MSFGCSWTAILKVKNSTESLIKEVKFTYNLDGGSTKVKNIKPGENKQTGISTLYNVKDIRMIVDGLDKSYLIKSKIPQAYMNTITIDINSINLDDCGFNILEGEVK